MGNKHRHGATTENAKKYQFVAANNIEGVLAEGWNSGWESWDDLSCAFDYTKPYADFGYGRDNKILPKRRVWSFRHHKTGGDIVNYERQLEDAFDWTKDKGINHIKTGYAGPVSRASTPQSVYGSPPRKVERAAAHKITLNVHEPIKPTGIAVLPFNMMSPRGAGHGVECLRRAMRQRIMQYCRLHVCWAHQWTIHQAL